MEQIYFGFVGAAFLLAAANWRAGIYACVLFEVLRDPIRKLTEDQSVMITVAPGLIWLGVFLGVLNAHQNELLSGLRNYPKLRTAVQLLILALVPGAIISLVIYPGGYKLVALGGLSYLAPLMGLAIGYMFARHEREVERLLSFYSILNAVVLVGGLLEYYGSTLPALGGIKMNWLRYHGDYTVNLIAGFYRSPDIMGLHAAHVIMFSSVLVMRRKGPEKLVWGGLASWGALCLLLAGRRKMMALPIAFFAAYLLLSLWRRSHTATRVTTMLGLAGLVVAVVLFSARQLDVSNEYEQYASTLVTQGSQRTQEIVGGSILGTIIQSGLMGDGLGTATQGSQYAAVKVQRHGWQEDGASRLFKEVGLFGVVFVGLAGNLFIQSLMRAMKAVPRGSTVLDLQLCLIAMLVANAACFIASHQQYSGDAMMSLFVVLLSGIVLGSPRMLAATRQALMRLQRSHEA